MVLSLVLLGQCQQEDSLKLAAFNVRIFGVTKFSNDQVVSTLSQVNKISLQTISQQTSSILDLESSGKKCFAKLVFDNPTSSHAAEMSFCYLKPIMYSYSTQIWLHVATQSTFLYLTLYNRLIIVKLTVAIPITKWLLVWYIWCPYLCVLSVQYVQLWLFFSCFAIQFCIAKHDSSLTDP